MRNSPVIFHSGLSLLLPVILCSALFSAVSAQTAPQFSGRFGAGVYAYYPEGSDNSLEPSFRGLVSVDHLLTESIHGALDARVRQEVGSAQGRTRIYEAWLGWVLTPQWEIQGGRLGNRGFGGVGFIDGGRLIFLPGKKFEMSLYGGNEPDLNTFGFGNDVSKMGIAANGHTEGNEATWGVSVLEQRYRGELDRRMLTENLSWLPSLRAYVYQNLELDFAYRQNNSDQSGLRISDFHLNASEAAGSDWRFNESVGFRRGFKMLRSMRDIADTLFEMDPVYDGSIGANWRIIPQINLRGDIRYQRKQSTNDEGTSGSVGWSANTNWTKPLYNFFDFWYNDNLYYAGKSYQVAFEMEVLAHLSPRIGFTIERNKYHSGFGGGNTDYNRNQAEVSFWYWLGDWNTGITGEFASVNNKAENRYSFDLGYRIPTHK